jgi:ubiquinone/menaquinone biosynthesis C-methylase UbiE
MEFKQAYLAIVNSSIEQDTKEIPLLLSVTNFKDKSCLEIGAGPLARIAKKIYNDVKNITCLEIYDATVKDINKIIIKENLENKITAILNKDKAKLPFKDNSFDIIYAGWIPSTLLKNKEYLSELKRVSKKDIIFLMSGEKGDIPLMSDLIKNQDEASKRLKTKEFITNYFLDKGYKVETNKETILKLKFKSLNEAFEVFHCFDFNNSLNETEQIKLKKYLSNKYDDFKDHLYIFHAQK